MNFFAGALMVFTWNTLPYHFFNIFGFFVFLIFNYRSFRLTNNEIIISIIIFAYALTVFFSSFVNKGEIGPGFFWFMALGILIFFRLSFQSQRDLLLGSVLTLLLLGFLDTYFRYIDLLETPFINFHALKFGNIGIDTNHSAYLFFLSFGIILFYGKLFLSRLSQLSIVFLFLMLIILSLSRSAWIGFLFISSIYLFRKSILTLFFLSFSLIVLCVYSLLSGDFLLTTDQSFLSRLEIIDSAIEYTNSWSLLNIILGVGGNVTLGSHSLHLLYPQIIFFSGLLGLSLWLGFSFLFLFLGVGVIILAINIVGWSFAPLSSPVLSLMLYFEYSVQRSKYNSYL